MIADRVISVEFFKTKMLNYQFESFQTAISQGLKDKLF